MLIVGEFDLLVEIIDDANVNNYFYLKLREDDGLWSDDDIIPTSSSCETIYLEVLFTKKL
ncbi:unnamed protein product [marine sediment metagenome]|uniref:Uncharacterized protein n=1 Tax=marine sediment metagenome TaxID=412755 RepID=X1V9A4_9ZZZZ